MSEDEKLEYYLQRLNILAKENIADDNTSAMEAIKRAINLIESELIGY